jgi:hypothetical protein
MLLSWHLFYHITFREEAKSNIFIIKLLTYLSQVLYFKKIVHAIPLILSHNFREEAKSNTFIINLLNV